MTTQLAARSLLAIGVICLGYFFFCISDAAVKMVASRYHYAQSLFLLGAMVATFMAVYAYFTQGKSAFVIRNKKWVWFRALLFLIGAVLNIFSLPHVQLTTFYTLVFTSPFWVALLSAFFLKERLDAQRLAVIAFGFAVVLYIFQPGSGLFNIWTLMVLCGSFLYSCSVIIMRYVGPNESRPMIVISGALLCAVFAAPIALQNWVMPTPYDWGLYIINAVTLIIGMLSVAYAFQHAPSAATVAPFHYTQIIWGAALGYIVFHDIPGTRVMIGAGLIILAGLYLIYIERKKKRLEEKPV